jgi:hypothetical protein
VNTHTRSTDPHTDERWHEDQPQRASRDQREHVEPTSGPVVRIIAGSVAAGLTAAVVLVGGVFPGATEATITGSILVAFGLGWALLGWAPPGPRTAPCAGPAFRPWP